MEENCPFEASKTSNRRLKLFLWGDSGSGKTTLALKFPSPAVIDLEGGSRSRPFVCEWNRDGQSDVLLGYGDGLVRLYTGVEHYHHTGAPEFALEPGAILLAPRPNPALGRSEIAFDLTLAQRVRLDVYDVSGRRVAQHADRAFGPGGH